MFYYFAININFINYNIYDSMMTFPESEVIWYYLNDWAINRHSDDYKLIYILYALWLLVVPKYLWRDDIIENGWPGGRFNKKMSSYQYRKSHCGDKTILRPSYLHNGISYTGKTASLYWIRALIPKNVVAHRTVTHLPLVPHMGICESGQHWLR